jgi:hypothetical protein
MPEVTLETAVQVKRRHEAELLHKPNVVAVGVGYRPRRGESTPEVCIVVSVRKKQPQSELNAGERIPESLEGVPVDVVETGAISAR